MASNIIFTHPGLNNSGPLHWQSLWENAYGFTRIQQNDWDAPDCDDWTSTIETTLATHPPENVILIGHSLACCTIVKWAERYGRQIKGALLVAPSDTEAPTSPPGTTGFMPMPNFKPPFPTIVVASSNDYYVSIERAKFFADNWGSKFVEAGALEHINASSNIGDWPGGYSILKKLLV